MSRSTRASHGVYMVRVLECVLWCVVALLVPWWIAGVFAIVRLLKDARYEMVCVALVLDALYGPHAFYAGFSFTFLFFCIGVLAFLLQGRMRRALVQSM
jgi:hypothetical protein